MIFHFIVILQFSFHFEIFGKEIGKFSDVFRKNLKGNLGKKSEVFLGKLQKIDFGFLKKVLNKKWKNEKGK